MQTCRLDLVVFGSGSVLRCEDTVLAGCVPATAGVCVWARCFKHCGSAFQVADQISGTLYIRYSLASEKFGY